MSRSKKKKKKMKKCKMYLSIRNLIKSNETDFFECCPFQSYFLMSLWKQNKMTYVWEELLNIKMEKTFVRGKENYSLSEKKWTWKIGWKMLIVLPEDFVRKVEDPQLIPVGRSRAFSISLWPCLHYLHFFMNSFDYKDFSSNDDI